MEFQLINYVQPRISSLRNIAIVPIVARLLAQPDVEKELNKQIEEVNAFEASDMFSAGNYNFYEIEEIIQKKLALLCIPKRLQAAVLDFVKPMGLLVIKCIDFRGSEYNRIFSSLFKGTIHWISRGTVDKIRPLEEKVFRSEQDVAIKILFSFACDYCCEKCLVEIWKRFPQHKREEYLQFSSRLSYIRFFDYWCLRLGDKEHDYRKYNNVSRRINSINGAMLEIAISKGNFLAFRYFWNKLTNEERMDENVFLYLKQVAQLPFNIQRDGYIRWYDRQVPSELADIMLFLLSHLSDQKRFYRKYPEIVLKVLYNHWPYQTHFLPTISLMWDFLDEKLYLDLVSIIATEANERRMSKELLIELWHCSPEKYKKCVEISKCMVTINKLLNIDTV